MTSFRDFNIGWLFRDKDTINFGEKKNKSSIYIDYYYDISDSLSDSVIAVECNELKWHETK